MKIVNMHDAKTHWSRLVDAATKGEAFVIAKAGKPMVRVSPLGDTSPKRLGFMAEGFTVPADFDDMMSEDLEAMFSGGGVEPSVNPDPSK